jgi:hypothetical protein
MAEWTGTSLFPASVLASRIDNVGYVAHLGAGAAPNRGGSATAAPATPVPRRCGPDIPTHSAASAWLSAKRDVG